MKLSKKDRIILANQYKILSKLDVDSSEKYEELVEILENGYEIFYNQIGGWISNDHPEEDGRFVLDILDLYRAIDDLKRKTKDDRILNHIYSIFRGFDGNNEAEELSFCRFLVIKQGKFQEQKKYLLENDYFNSHVPMMDKYRAMLEKSKGIDIWNMSIDEALGILDAKSI